MWHTQHSIHTWRCRQPNRTEEVCVCVREREREEQRARGCDSTPTRMEEGHPPPAAGVPHLRMSPLQRHAPNTNPTPPSRFREAGLPRRRTQSMYQASSPHISPRPSPATKRVVQQLRTTGNHSSSPKQRLFRSGSRTSMFSVDSEGLETGSSSSGGGGPPLHSTPSLSNLLESRSFCVTPEFTETRTRLHRTMSTQSLVRDDFFPGFSSPVSMRADTPQR